MTNMTGGGYDELAARVSALETQVGSLRARTADMRGELAQVHDAVQDIRMVQGEHSARLEEHSQLLTGLAAAHGLLGDEVRGHTVTLGQHTVTLRQHTATLAEHGEMLREILRRLDAA